MVAIEETQSHFMLVGGYLITYQLEALLKKELNSAVIGIGLD